MATPAQIAANRANAQKSTGPRTSEGKARACLNARRHGLYGRDVTVSEADHEAFRDILSEFDEAFAPQGSVETALVRRGAEIWWRLERALALERAALDTMAIRVGENRITMHGRDVRALARFGRLEARLQRMFEAFVARLERCQARRVQSQTKQDHSGRAAAPRNWVRSVKFSEWLKRPSNRCDGCVWPAAHAALMPP